MTEQPFDTVSILLIFLMVSMMTIFSLSILIFIIRRSIQIKQLKRKGFMLIIISYTVGKLVVCLFLVVWIIRGIPKNWQNISHDQIERLFKNSLIISQISMVELFMVVFEFYISVCITIIPRLSRIPQQIQKGFYIAEAVYLLVAGVLTILYNVKILEYMVMNLFELITNLLLILAFFVSFFYLNFLMTGIFLSEETRGLMNRLYKLVIVLVFSRFFVVTIFDFVVETFISDDSFSGFINLIEEKKNQYIIQCLIFIAYLLYILITEGLPIIYSLRSSTFKIFTVLKSQNQDQLQVPIIDHYTDQNIYSQNNIQHSIYNQVFDTITQLDNFTAIQQLSTFKSELWTYYRGQYQNKIYLIRKCKRVLSNYLIEDLAKQMETINAKNIQELNPIGYFTVEDTLYIYEPYRFNALVGACLSKDSQSHNKALILQQLALAIKRLHDKNFVIGCLGSDNIFMVGNAVEKNSYKIRFSGYGLRSLKRYFSFISDYSNKNLYTAPEILTDRNAVVLKAKKPADIYSLGMIVYECFTNNLSYRQLTFKQLQAKMGNDNFRPKISEQINTEVSNLIRWCWRKQPQNRPTIDEAIQILNKIVHQI